MLASALVLGIIAAVATRGDLRRLSDIRPRLWPLILLAVGLRVVALVLSSAWIFAISLLGIAFVCLVNYRINGLPLVGVGTALNFVVVAANGGMPISQPALDAAGATLPSDGVHITMSASTVANWLGDVLPIAMVRGVYSVGDVVSAVGAFWLPIAGSRK